MLLSLLGIPDLDLASVNAAKVIRSDLGHLGLDRLRSLQRKRGSGITTHEVRRELFYNLFIC